MPEGGKGGAGKDWLERAGTEKSTIPVMKRRILSRFMDSMKGL